VVKMTDITIAARPRLKAHVRVQWDPVREQHVLLAPEGVLVLNETAAAILALCGGRRTVAGIIDELRTRYNHVPDEEVFRFFRRLSSKGLVNVDDS